METRFCQSCGMPMETDDLLGTNADNTANEDYCVYCYKDGAFTDSGTLQDMIEVCVPHMVKTGMAEEQARVLLMDQLPRLKRWQAG